MTDCLFCKVVNGDIPSEKVYEDDRVYAFKDISPQAPVHVLVVPKKHIATLNDLEPEHNALIGDLFLTAKKIATDFNVTESGYRTVINCNEGAGQSVFHIHLHLMAGRNFSWPPG